MSSFLSLNNDLFIVCLSFAALAPFTAIKARVGNFVRYTQIVMKDEIVFSDSNQ